MSSAPYPVATPPGTGDHGLICAYQFGEGHVPRPLANADESLSLLESSDSGFVWLHFNLAHAGCSRWLREHAGLGKNFLEALTDGSRSARIEVDADSLFAVLNDVAYDFSFDAQEVETLWVNVSNRLVVSARRRPLKSVDRLRTAVKRGEQLQSTVALLDHLLRDQGDELQRILQQAGGRLDDIEDAVLAGHHRRHGAELARLRRLMVRLQRLLTPEPGGVTRALSRPPTWMSPRDTQQLARSNDDFSLVLRDVATLQDRIRLMQDESASRQAEQNNRSLFLLTMVTVLALPINLTSGLFGMNVGGVPFSDHPAGFWIMAALIGVVTGLIARAALRRWRDRE